MPLGPNDPRFQVDAAPMAGFDIDTRHDLDPQGLTSSFVLRFPGSTTGYAVTGVAPPPPIIVDGVLRADSFDALHALIFQHHSWVASTGIVTVTLYETDYPNCKAMDFRKTGPPRVYSDDGETAKAQCNARFVFEQLQA
ncbi:MAG: hypothetical protein AAGI37_06930 [Planctomycetota bacterium]